MKLLVNALSKVIAGFALILLLLFLPAGTMNYPGGWLFTCALFIPMVPAGIVMLLKSPDLLKKRLSAKEKQKEQSLVIKLSGLMFLLGFISAGISYRYTFLLMPRPLSLCALVVFVLSYLMYFEVLRENAYLSRTIEVHYGQKVIDTGLYGIIRHPMYTATIFMFLSIPFILSSWLSLIFFLFYPLLIILRLKNEEKVLEEELTGYKEYKNKVRFRLIPFIW